MNLSDYANCCFYRDFVLDVLVLNEYDCIFSLIVYIHFLFCILNFEDLFMDDHLFIDGQHKRKKKYYDKEIGGISRTLNWKRLQTIVRIACTCYCNLKSCFWKNNLRNESKKKSFVGILSQIRKHNLIFLWNFREKKKVPTTKERVYVLCYNLDDKSFNYENLNVLLALSL